MIWFALLAKCIASFNKFEVCPAVKTQSKMGSLLCTGNESVRAKTWVSYRNAGIKKGEIIIKQGAIRKKGGALATEGAGKTLNSTIELTGSLFYFAQYACFENSWFTLVLWLFLSL